MGGPRAEQANQNKSAKRVPSKTHAQECKCFRACPSLGRDQKGNPIREKSFTLMGTLIMVVQMPHSEVDDHPLSTPTYFQSGLAKKSFVCY